MLNTLSPIALFVYKRPEHTALTLEHLIRNPGFAESVLHVFCDGPKNSKDIPLVEATRQTVRKFALPNLVLHEQPHNVGLSNSIIQGVNKLCEEYGRTIVLEDDLLVAHGFLDYMNRALDKYASEEQVMHICGYIFPFYKHSDTDNAFFLPVTNSWGWATWQRAWRSFDPKCIGYEALRSDRSLRKRFDLGGTYPYSRMMFAEMASEPDDWALQWWWSVFRQEGLCLYPRDSLVNNIGFGITATHTKSADTYVNDPQWSADRTVLCLPDKVEPDNVNYELLKKYIASHYGSLTARTKRQITKFRNLLVARFQQLIKLND